MSLGFYTDASMTRLITQLTMKRFCLPLTGGSKQSTVYLGDPYFTYLAASTTSADTVVYLQDTSEFLSAGTAIINGTSFTYTAKTSSTLTGCSGVPVATANTVIKPNKVYKCPGNLVVSPTGAGFSNQLNIQLSTNYPTVPFGFSQSPAIYSLSTITMGQVVPLSIQVNMTQGTVLEISNWSVTSVAMAVRDVSDSTAITNTEALEAAVMYGYAYRSNQSPDFNQRVIQLNREITNLNPGFIIGDYRWRSSNTTNGYGFIPPNWNLNPTSIGINKFQSGIGYGDDIELLDLVNQSTSIYPVLQSGQYFYRAFRNNLPATTQIDILSGIATEYTLTKVPTSQTPIQVGVWSLDTNGTYIPFLSYTQVATLVNTDGSDRTDLPANYFIVNRKTGVLTLSSSTAIQTAYLGSITSDDSQTFTAPFYPLASINLAYCDYGFTKPRVYATSITVDPDSRIITVTIPGANVGDNIYIDFQIQVAAIYDVGTANGTRTETSVDLNPAYSGLANGYYYIEQRIRQSKLITLTCDKPIIDVPATFSNVPNLIAYGPVYLKNDYALLTAQAFTSISNEVMPNARLRVIPSETFSGLINYLDPTTEEIIVVTGGDGKVNLVYTPEGNGGYYIPATVASGSLAGLATTNVTNDTLILPAGIPISQLWNASDGWLLYTYNVFNDKPFYGQLGADPALGEIPYATTGTAGEVNFTSNGQLTIWVNGSDLVVPLDARDTSNNSYTSPSFNGIVSKLIYPTAVISANNIPAYYIDFLQRVTLQVEDIDTGVYSNTILLQMQPPTVIQDNPWLILNDATDGIINQFRLGWISPGV